MTVSIVSRDRSYSALVIPTRAFFFGEVLMKVLVAGVFRMSGVSSKTGRSYDMTQLVILNRVEEVSLENLVKGGHGFEPAKLDCTPEVLQSLRDARFPCHLDVDMQLRSRGGNQVPFVVGAAVSAPASKLASAG